MSENSRFIDNGDGTAKDTATGLVWCKKDSWQIVNDWLNFQEALQFVDSMNRKDFLGFHDWRLPEKEEVEKLYLPGNIVKGRSNLDLFIDPAFEPGCGNGCWCLPFDQRAAFYFSYQSGVVQAYDQDFSQGYVRLVRLYSA
ncbi:MAG: DUF1566 domain-containing protein [Nitrospinae bacterium]|nr:DUF1566 domain-containing protein [Nitrospinota bacterium]